MENKNTINDMHWRQYEAETTEPQAHKPVSPSEQGVYDRWQFEQFVASHPLKHNLTPQEMPRRYSAEDAAVFIASILPTTNKPTTDKLTLGKQYQWLSRIDPEVIARLMNEIDEFRLDYLAKHDKLPTDPRIYREYRLKLEQHADDPYLKDVVPVLGALMGDDLTNGTLPI